MKRKLFGALAALAMALMWGAAASDGAGPAAIADAEIRPDGASFVHDEREYGLLSHRDGSIGTIRYCVNVKRAPQPHVEHILSRDVQVEWSSPGLSTLKADKNPTGVGMVFSSVEVQATNKGQWGKVHEVNCTLTWTDVPPGRSPHQLGKMTLTGHVVAPEVEVKEIHFNHRTGQNANDAIDLVANAGDTAPAAVVPEYVAGRKDNYPVAYIPGVKPSVKAVFAVRPGFIPSLTVSSPAPVAGNPGNPYQILEGLPEVAAERGAGGQTPSGDAATFTALLQDGRETPRVIGNHTVSLRWRVESMANVKFTGGYWEYLAETTQNNVYTLLDAPKMPWNDGGGGEGAYPWFGALEFVIGPAKNGKTCGTDGIADAHEAMRKITEHLFYRHGGLYDTSGGYCHFWEAISNNLQDLIGFKFSVYRFNFNAYIKLPNKSLVNCYDQAGALYICSRLVGINSAFYFMEPFGMIKPTYLVGYDKKCNNPFFNDPDPEYQTSGSYLHEYVKDETTIRSGFGNHAFAVYDDVVYDACAGPIIGKSKSRYIDDTIDTEYHAIHPRTPHGNLEILERAKRDEIPQLIHE